MPVLDFHPRIQPTLVCKEKTMCPACIAATAWPVAGVTSTGGLTVLIAKKLRAKTSAENVEQTTQTKGDQNGSSKRRITG